MFFKLKPNAEKCLKEEVHKDILVKGNYQIEELANVDVNLKITDSKDHILFQKDEASEGKFAFTKCFLYNSEKIFIQLNFFRKYFLFLIKPMYSPSVSPLNQRASLDQSTSL